MHKNEKGQTLVIVVSVMVVALAVGMSLSTRYFKGLKSVVQTDSSSRALAVAEAGVEHLFSLPMETLVDYVTNGTCGASCHIEIPGEDGVPAVADMTIRWDGNTSENYPITLDSASTTEISLAGYPSGSSLTICLDTVSITNPLVVSAYLVYGSPGNYLVDNYLFDLFGCHNVAGRSDPVALRIRSIYYDLTGYVQPAVGATIPAQGILLESTGTVAEATRKVRVLKSYKALPTEFDYVLFSK